MDDLGNDGDVEVSLPVRLHLPSGLAAKARDNPPPRYPVQERHPPERFDPS